MQIHPTAPAAAAPAEAGTLATFVSDESGAVFLEFLIVLFAWMFIMFGVIQVGLIATASFYVNYANFMALRTAAVHYEMYENGFESKSEMKNKCTIAAMEALLPMEHYLYKHRSLMSILSGGNPLAAGGDLLDFYMRVDFKLDDSDSSLPKLSGSGAQNGRLKYIKGHTEYKYYLIVPFANYVFAAFDPSNSSSTADHDRVMQDFKLSIPADKPYPTLTIKSNDDLSNESGSPRDHVMVVQRRWLYDKGN